MEGRLGLLMSIWFFFRAVAAEFVVLSFGANIAMTPSSTSLLIATACGMTYVHAHKRYRFNMHLGDLLSGILAKDLNKKHQTRVL